MSETIIKTNISQAFWCKPGGKPEPAKAPDMSPEKTLSWFDMLFDGGIRLPNTSHNRALTLLITGPPGSGKSTFATELCYKLTNSSRWQKNAPKKEETFRSLYITTESNYDLILNNAESLGWEPTAFLEIGKDSVSNPHVTIWQASDFDLYFETEGKSLFDGVIGAIEYLERKRPLGHVITDAQGRTRLKVINKQITRQRPDILVVDSLNTIDPKARSTLFKNFTELITKNIKLVIFILDSSPSNNSAEIWEYFCDIVMRLDRRYDSNYMLRSIEIVKARYQQHVWGKHQLKIYPGLDRPNVNHPYRQEGGIFIYPSIHYYLSTYKKSLAFNPPNHIKLPVKGFDQLLQGFPEGRCTALVGARGGHKSHVGYLFLLSRLLEKTQDNGCIPKTGVDDKDKVLIISLRDDEGMAEKTMISILRQEFNLAEKMAAETFKNFKDTDKLEILYYHPGYITPEEFFHKMFMAIHRLKRSENDRLTVLFNSLDQLASRFPLCANEKIFIPGIVDTLIAQNITSVFVGVEEAGQPGEHYGLLSMADLIIAFKHKKEGVDVDVYCEQVRKHIDTIIGSNGKTIIKDFNVSAMKNNSFDKRNPVFIRIVRHSGGQAAGDGGILELVDKKDKFFKEIYSEQGLVFIPFVRT